MDDIDVDIENTQDEPSILSPDPNERKLARRLRIKRRLSAARKAQSIADGTYEAAEPPKPLLEQTIENSDDTLIQLFLEGKELVTNVRIASDTREVQRRHEEVEARNVRMQKLEEEADLAMQKLNEITAKWEDIQGSNDPLDLFQDMKNQKDKCLELIQQKDDLIKDFQVELRLADERFMKDRRRMYEDISMMAKRIDEQVLVMKNAYRTELQMIEDAIDETRRSILDEHQNKWQDLYDHREKDEVGNIDRKFNMVADHEEEIRRLHIDHEEKYRDTKIRLETDIQALEQELEHVKALCLLNSEKLDYNYQVLKKREEENIYIKNHQKRRLNKLQDTVNTLRKKIAEKQSATDQELKRLTAEVTRYHNNVLDVEEKADHFAQINEQKYQNIWDMKQEEAQELLDKILATDRIIHEQILEEDWTPPETILMDKKDLPSYQSAVKAVNELFDGERGSTVNLDGDGSREEHEGYKRLLRHILEMVADQSGFLIEDRLEELLTPYTEDEVTLVLLDNVFTAIGIRTEKDIDILKDFFLPYSKCNVCDETTSTRSIAPGSSGTTSTEAEGIAESSSGGRAATSQQSNESQMLMGMNQEMYQDSADPLELLKGKYGIEVTTTCNITHPRTIDKVFVLKALKDFVSKYHSDKSGHSAGIEVRLAKERSTISRLLSKEDIDTYWQRFTQVFPAEEEKVWDALFDALTKYHHLLQERHKLNTKAQKLRSQNADLRHLLSKYMSEEQLTQAQRMCLPNISAGEKNNMAGGESLLEIIRSVSK